jgi:hypothetical protein
MSLMIIELPLIEVSSNSYPQIQTYYEIPDAIFDPVDFTGFLQKRGKCRLP